jgi:hypothetical protein
MSGKSKMSRSQIAWQSQDSVVNLLARYALPTVHVSENVFVRVLQRLDTPLDLVLKPTLRGSAQDCVQEAIIDHDR